MAPLHVVGYKSCDMYASAKMASIRSSPASNGADNASKKPQAALETNLLALAQSDELCTSDDHLMVFNTERDPQLEDLLGLL